MKALYYMDNFDPRGWTPPRRESGEEPASPADTEPEGEQEAPYPPTLLDKYDVTDEFEELKRSAASQRPLLGPVCLSTQTTVIYAKPNTGKTLLVLHLLIEAVREGRIDGERCYYIDADDNPAGLVEKIELLKPYGVKVLAPGLAGFDIKRLRPIMEKMAADRTANGCLVVIDTVKKVADLMSKRESSEFASLCRSFIMAGGTIVGLAHTNKRNDALGRAIYAGTSDVVDDIDCAYTIQELERANPSQEKMVQFGIVKRRGNNPDELAFVYDATPNLSYVARLSSVRQQTSDDLARAKAEAELAKDADVIATIEDCIREGVRSKMELAREVTKRVRYIGRDKVGKIIDLYEGEDPAVHRWTFTTVEHGKRQYRLIGSDGPDVDPDEVF